MPPSTHSPLRRFVTDGLRDTIDSYTAGTLPLHRFVWELETRLNTLIELTGLPHYRTLGALRSAQQSLAALDTELRATGREGLTNADEHTLGAAVTTLRTTLRTTLARLDPDDPIDPMDPTQPRPVVLAFPTRPATGGRSGHRRVSGDRRTLTA
jgi:hypothetical protein